jgi:LysM repeat protein
VKDCPVCGKVGLADDVQECPQCNADLECFELLESLHEEVARPEQSESGLAWKKELEDLRTTLSKDLGNQQASAWMRSYGILALFVLVLGALILFLYRDLILEEHFNNVIFQLESRIGPVGRELKTTELSELNAKMETITQRLVAIENGLTAVSAAHQEAVGTGSFSAILEYQSKLSERLVCLEKEFYDIAQGRSPSPDENSVPVGTARDEVFLYHEPGKGETLWSIARRYYDSGRFYPVLLEYNPGLGIYFDRSYGRIKILKDRQRAKQVLDEVMTVRGNVTLIHYKVMKGDAWERISERFYGNTADVAKLLALNPGVGLAPGDRVFVPLP